MSVRPFALIAAAAMVGGFFLPWMSGPTGASLVPFDAVKGLNSTQLQDMLTSLPPEGMAFFASFALAALLVLLAIMGFAPRLLTFVTGGIPMGFLGWGYYKVTQTGSFMGTPASGTDMSQLFQQLTDMLGVGAWAWLGGGAMLLLMGLFSTSRS